MEDKIDIHHRKREFETYLRNLQNDETMIPQNKEHLLKFIRDCRLGKTLRNRQKKVIGNARCTKYIHILKRISEWLNKPFEEVTQENMESFIEGLENDKYLGKIGYRGAKSIILSPSTKVDYKKILKKFYKWLLGKNDQYPELVDWIETYDTLKEISALRREEVEKMVAASKTRDKAIIMLLFDSGARAEEFLNIRLHHLSKNGETYKIRIAHSKTKPRTIHVPLCTEYLDMWLNEYEEHNEDSLLFPISYDGLRVMISRVGKRVLNKRVTPHILRHTSATYYANLLKNQFKLCYRYGWAMASKMPNRYIDREGLIEEETIEIVKANEVSILQKENQELKEKISLQDEDFKALRNEFRTLGKNVDGLKITSQPTFQPEKIMNMLYNLANQQQEMSKVLEKISGTKFDIIVPLSKPV